MQKCLACPQRGDGWPPLQRLWRYRACCARREHGEHAADVPAGARCSIFSGAEPLAAGLVLKRQDGEASCANTMRRQHVVCKQRYKGAGELQLDGRQEVEYIGLHTVHSADVAICTQPQAPTLPPTLVSRDWHCTLPTPNPSLQPLTLRVRQRRVAPRLLPLLPPLRAAAHVARCGADAHHPSHLGLRDGTDSRARVCTCVMRTAGDHRPSPCHRACAALRRGACHLLHRQQPQDMAQPQQQLHPGCQAACGVAAACSAMATACGTWAAGLWLRSTSDSGCRWCRSS